MTFFLSPFSRLRLLTSKILLIMRGPLGAILETSPCWEFSYDPMFHDAKSIAFPRSIALINYRCRSRVPATQPVGRLINRVIPRRRGVCSAAIKRGLPTTAVSTITIECVSCALYRVTRTSYRSRADRRMRRPPTCTKIHNFERWISEARFSLNF